MAAAVFPAFLNLPSSCPQRTFPCQSRHGGIPLACIVHLAACPCSRYGPNPGPAGWPLSGDEALMAKKRTRLAVGSLRALARVWALAGDVLA